MHRRLIFDTSEINVLRRDSDRVLLIKGLGLCYQVGITETSLVEIAATPEEQERRALLDVLKHFVFYGSVLCRIKKSCDGRRKPIN